MFSTLREVFSNWKYALLAVFIFLVFYLFNVFVQNFSSIISYYSMDGLSIGTNFFVALVLGFGQTMGFTSFLSLVFIGILFGVLFSLILYRTKMVSAISKELGFFGSVGIFLGVLVPGCAACGIGLLSLFGFGAVTIAFLPFDGLEISWLAIGILGFSIFKISKDIKKGIVCEIK